MQKYTKQCHQDYAYHFPIATSTNLILTNILIDHLIAIFILKNALKISLKKKY
jgi:hypothetical protein